MRSPPPGSSSSSPRQREKSTSTASGRGRPSASSAASAAAAFCAWWRAVKLKLAPREPLRPSATVAVRRRRREHVDVVALDREVLGTTAVPPGGSAAISSPFARATPSSESDELQVHRADVRDHADLGPRDPHSAAIWPKPRIASSRTQTSVSGSSRQSVSGTPISLL